MKHAFYLAAALCLGLSSATSAADAPKPWGAVPSPAQMYYYRQEIASLIHYGPNTYVGTNGVEWGDSGLYTPDSMMLPETLDTDQWVRAAKAAGIRRIVMVAKHHDGFRLWKTSEYSIAQTSPKNNPKNIDLIEEFSKSCTKIGMDMGIYISPWDVYEDKGRQMQGLGEGVYGNGSGTPGLRPMDDDYNRLFERHLRELFCDPDKKYGRGGRMAELWLDGAKNARKLQVYDFPAWLRIIEDASGIGPDGKKDPTYLCLNYQGGEDQTVSWAGNEHGTVNSGYWSKMTPPLPLGGRVDLTRRIQNPTGTRWVVWEGDFPMRPGWFYHKNQDGRTKNGPELFRRYLRSVGNGGIMMVGLAPDRRGLLSDEDVRALTEFGRLRRETFGENDSNNLLRSCRPQIASSAPIHAGSPAYGADKLADVGENAYDTYWAPTADTRSATLTVDFGSVQTFDLIRLQEYIPLGQRIDSYRIEVRSAGRWIPFGKGTVIGWQRLIAGPVTRADRLRITVGSHYAAPILCNLGIYKMPTALEMRDSRIPAGLSVINDSAFGGSPFDAKDCRRFARPQIEGVRDLIGSDSTLMSGNTVREIPFTGSKCWLRGAREIRKDIGSDLLVSLDGGTPIRVDATSDATRDLRHPFRKSNMGIILYTSPDLPCGKHTLRITLADPSKEATLDALLVCGSPLGCFEFAEPGDARVKEGDSVTVGIRRLGDASGPVTVTVASDPGTAVHGEDFIQEAKNLTFAPGERIKNVTFRTRDNFKTEGPQYFILRIEPDKARDIPDSFVMTRRVVIRDND